MGGDPRRNGLKTALILVLSGLGLGACQSYIDRYSASFESALTAADRQQMIESAQSALENNKTGESANWHDPESGHLGTVTPIRTFEQTSGGPCRDYQQTVTVEGKTGVAYRTACRGAEGTWQISGSADLAGVSLRWEPAGYRPVEYIYDCGPYWGGCPPYWYDSPYYWHRYPYRYPYPYYGGGSRYSLHLGYGHYF